MPRIPTLRAGLLDLAAGIGMAGPALMVLYSYDRRELWTTIAVAPRTAPRQPSPSSQP